jgi:hypothetical protein
LSATKKTTEEQPTRGVEWLGSACLAFGGGWLVGCASKQSNTQLINEACKVFKDDFYLAVYMVKAKRIVRLFVFVPGLSLIVQ